MPLYTSIENRAFLGRWSPEYVGAMVVAIAAWAATIWIAARSWRRQRTPQAPALLVDAALLSWGAAYLISAIDDPDSASRLLDFKPFGSVAAVSVLLEWLALLFLLSAAVAWLARVLPRRLLNVGLMLLSLALLLLLGEGAARVKAVGWPAVVGFPTYSLTIWERRNIALNSLGYRDREHVVAKPDSARRLLVIGDSYAFGWGLSRLADRFGEQLAARLESATGTPWEAINISKADRHTRQQVEFLRAGLPYRPDVVVLVYVFNDIDYLSVARGALPLTTRNVLSEAPRNLLDRLHPLRLLYWNSYLVQELYVRLRALRWRFMRSDPSRDLYADSSALATHVRDLAQLAAEARAGGAVLGIVPFEPAVVYRDDVRRRYDRFVAAARRGGLLVWSLRDAFGARDHSSLVLSSLDAHPNELAHRLAAEAVLPEVLRVAR
ncbi:MAG TPA: SGNH/GDSL hydrolase family protein [Gemmatimonadaceae bacterium]|nr:SGNH/GDSL hydrolase family protein [Gemmatimonadaceae bacterium]